MSGGQETTSRELSPEELLKMASTFGMLASTTRLHIVWVLAGGECDVGTVAERVGESLQTVSHHLAKLKLAGLVRSRREGRRQVYFADDPCVMAVVAQIAESVSDPPAKRRGLAR